MSVLRPLAQVALVAASSLPFLHVAPGIHDSWQARQDRASRPSDPHQIAAVPRTPVAHPFAASSLFGALAHEEIR